MIEIIVGTMIYTATLLGCYDGDTCKVQFENTPEILAVQSFRFEGFDTPELRGKCDEEKSLARLAKQETFSISGSNYITISILSLVTISPDFKALSPGIP